MPSKNILEAIIKSTITKADKNTLLSDYSEDKRLFKFQNAEKI